jgi:hypothetical protein
MHRQHFVVAIEAAPGFVHQYDRFRTGTAQVKAQAGAVGVDPGHGMLLRL